jgi:hypothetical protein
MAPEIQMLHGPPVTSNHRLQHRAPIVGAMHVARPQRAPKKDAVEEAAHGLSGTNKRVIPVQVDVTLEQSVIDALSEVERALASCTSRATTPACRCMAPG